MQPTRARTSKAGDNHDELRCGCGRLLARHVEEGLELRCVRCKQPLVVRVENGVITCVGGHDCK